MIKEILAASVLTFFMLSTAQSGESKIASTSWQLMSLAELKAKQNKDIEDSITVKDAVDYAKFFSPVGDVDFTKDGLNEIKLAQRKDEIIKAVQNRVDNFTGLNSLVVFFSDTPKKYHDYDIEKEAFSLEPMRKNTSIQSKNHDLIDREQRDGKSSFFSGRVNGIIINHEFVDNLPVDVEKASKVIDEAHLRNVHMQYILYPIDYDGEMVHYEIVGYRATGRDVGLYENKVIGTKLNQKRLIELGLESLEVDQLIDTQSQI